MYQQILINIFTLLDINLPLFCHMSGYSDYLAESTNYTT